MEKRNSLGPRSEPWGTPQVIFLSVISLNLLVEFIQITSKPPVCCIANVVFSTFCHNKLWLMVSNAFRKSPNSPTVNSLLSIAVEISSTSFIAAVDVDLLFLKPNWFQYIYPEGFSGILEKSGSRQIVRWLVNRCLSTFLYVPVILAVFILRHENVDVSKDCLRKDVSALTNL